MSTLNINSFPQGANIFIDGVDQGTVTPATITNLSAGNHSYKLTLSSYDDAEGTFYIVEGETKNINVVLLPLPGSLNISSTPEGANIFIDGTDTGKITPAIGLELEPGIHLYKLVMEGYIDKEGTVEIVSEQESVITETLIAIHGDNTGLAVVGILAIVTLAMLQRGLKL